MRSLTAEELSLIEEAIRSGRSFSWRGEGPPTRKTASFGRQITRPKPTFVLHRGDALSSQHCHWQRGTSRQRRPQARRAVRAGASRDGPTSTDDDPDLTALQRAHLVLLEALCMAAEDGLRTYRTLLDLAATKIAAEIARLSDWNEPS